MRIKFNNMRKSTFISLFVSLVGIFPLMAACGGSKDEPASANTNHSVTLTASPESLSAMKINNNT